MSDSGQRLTGNNQGSVIVKNVDCQIHFTAPSGKVMIMGIYSKPGQPEKFGIGMYNAGGVLVQEVDFTTWLWYKEEDNKNMMQAGLLPDDSYGIVIAKDGQDVRDAFSE